MSEIWKKFVAFVAARKVEFSFAIAFVVGTYSLYDFAGSPEKFVWYSGMIAFLAVTIWRFGKDDFMTIVEVLRGNKEKVSKITLGHSITSVLDYAYDYGLYVPVIDAYSADGIKGVLHAYMLLTTGSAIASYIEIVIYDKLGDDWLGWEAAKDADDFGQEFLHKLNPKTLVGRLVIPIARMAVKVFAWAIKKNTFTAHIAMSVAFDPFHTTIYLRKGSEYNGLSARDWKIFFTSAIVANAWWTVRTYGWIWLIKNIFELVWKFVS